MSGKPIHRVMLSSTYMELVEHRKVVQQAILSHELYPVAMENDAALPDHDLISASLSKVDDADAYVGLISYRYGQAPDDVDRNPDKLSLTELEFRRAVERKIPICMFIMDDNHLVPRRAIDAENDFQRQKLAAFITLAKKDRIYAQFESAGDLKAKAVQSLVRLREFIEQRSTPVVLSAGAAGTTLESPDVPPGWHIIDRKALATIRAYPPSLDLMIQFFDGILPTWRLALAAGIQPRAISERLANRLRAVHAGASRPKVMLLAGAGGEGKSTALLHAAAALVEDPQQAWTCVHRQSTNAALPEDTLSKLPISPDHAWIVVIDDADNIAPDILAAVKKTSARTDVHVLLAARDAEWKLIAGIWHSLADFTREPLAGLDKEDARRIVAGWAFYGDAAMGIFRGRSEADATWALLGHAREFATRREDGELLGALLVTRKGDDMRAHVRTLVNGLDRTPVIKSYSLRDIYAMVAAMHAENQLYLSRSVLSFAIGCEIDELERKALQFLRSEAMLDSGQSVLLTRHRRIAEAACAVMREDGENVDRWYPLLARAARKHFLARRPTPDIALWNRKLADHFVTRGDSFWTIAQAIAKAVYEAEPGNGFLLSAYSSVLRQTGRAADAMQVLKKADEKLKDDRALLYEWSTAAGAAHDHGLAVWLGGRSIADGKEPIDMRRCELSLAGLGIATGELYRASRTVVFAKAQAACGQLGLLLPQITDQTRESFQLAVTDGHRNGIADLSPEQAVDAIHQAVKLGANEVEPNNDPVFFEKLLGDPGGYRYTKLLSEVSRPLA